MSEWNGDNRRENTSYDFSVYKEMILSDIHELKEGFKEFRAEVSRQITEMQVTLATLNGKLIAASAITSMIVGVIVAVGAAFVK